MYCIFDHSEFAWIKVEWSINDVITFHGDLLFAGSRMSEQIHLDADLPHGAFFRPGGIWNFINNNQTSRDHREPVGMLGATE